MGIKTFFVPPRWLFIKIETDERVCGWGEAVLESRGRTVAATVSEFANYLLDKDPSPVEDHWTVLLPRRFLSWRRNSYKRIGGNRSGIVVGSGFASITWSLFATMAPARLIGLTGGVCHFFDDLAAVEIPIMVEVLAPRADLTRL